MKVTWTALFSEDNYFNLQYFYMLWRTAHYSETVAVFQRSRSMQQKKICN